MVLVTVHKHGTQLFPPFPTLVGKKGKRSHICHAWRVCEILVVVMVIVPFPSKRLVVESGASRDDQVRTRVYANEVWNSWRETGGNISAEVFCEAEKPYYRIAQGKNSLIQRKLHNSSLTL
jgi:hypothetical protein